MIVALTIIFIILLYFIVTYIHNRVYYPKYVCKKCGHKSNQCNKVIIGDADPLLFCTQCGDSVDVRE